MVDGEAPGLSEAKLPKRRVYDGRFAELIQAYEAGRRPSQGARVTTQADARKPRVNVFGDRWLILEHVDGEMPDIRACAIVSKVIRNAMLSGYQQIGLEHYIPAVVSGHDPDGTPTRTPHLAITPLAFASFPFADGHVMGFALVPPTGSSGLDDDEFRRAFRHLAPFDENLGRRILSIKPREGTPSDSAFSIVLLPTYEPPARSLDPALYLETAQSFGTVTPIVLDRHLREKGAARDDEINDLIAKACRNIGLPEPEAIIPDKHSAVEGAPSAYPTGKSPSWMQWRLPPALATRQLTHAVIRFATPVDGPLILGAGRFLGLGLCRPIPPEGR